MNDGGLETKIWGLQGITSGPLPNYNKFREMAEISSKWDEECEQEE